MYNYVYMCVIVCMCVCVHMQGSQTPPIMCVYYVT